MSTAAETTKEMTLNIRDFGLKDYRQVLELQHEMREKVSLGQSPNTVLIVEHPAVITLGARKSANKLLANRQHLAQEKIDVVEIRRGGGTTAHNPGQLIFYPILRLSDFGLGISEYIRKLEAIGIELLNKLGLISKRQKGYPGLWVADKKIASIGVRVTKLVTYHGMAINIQNDLGIFDNLIPCGLEGIEMTSVLEETGGQKSMSQIKQMLSELLKKHLAATDKSKTTARKLPPWLRRPLPAGQAYHKTAEILDSLDLETICNSANCPNRGQCWARGTATVLILGRVCTRNCKFCSVPTGQPEPPDTSEPDRIAEMTEQMKLKYLVITSVNRDDLPDGGAAHFRDCVNAVRRKCPETRFEILTPDFRNCQPKAIEILADAGPFVFAHNLETVPSLYETARAGADYQGSLNLLRMAKQAWPDRPTKSSMMLGLGETDNEVELVLENLRNVGCDRITIGQYLKPSKNFLDVVDYIEPAKFDQWKEKILSMGFAWVISSPFARSSYFAEQENTT